MICDVPGFAGGAVYSCGRTMHVCVARASRPCVARPILASPSQSAMWATNKEQGRDALATSRRASPPRRYPQTLAINATLESVKTRRGP